MPFKRISSASEQERTDGTAQLAGDPARRRLAQSGSRVLVWRPAGLRSLAATRPHAERQMDDRGEATASDAVHANDPQLPSRARHERAGTIAADDVNIGHRAKHAASAKKSPEPTAMYRTPMPIRVVQLTADAIVLTLASPVFAVWWLVRKGRQWIGRP